MKFQITHLGGFIYRMPLFSKKIYFCQDKYDDISQYIYETLKNIRIQEAIYVASPSLYKEIKFYIKDPVSFTQKNDKFLKFAISILFYLNRMTTRSTPFGTFAGFGVGQFANIKTLEDIDFSVTKVVEFDNSCLLGITEKLTQINLLKEDLVYFPNNTIYNIGTQKYRYIEYHETGYKNRIYNISLFESNKMIESLILKCFNGLTYRELVSIVNKMGHNLKSSKLYVESLIDAKILISELEPNILEQSFHRQIANFIKNNETKLPCKIINTIKPIFLNNNHRSIDEYITLGEDIEKITSTTYRNIIKIDSIINKEKPFTLPNRVVKEVKNGLRYYFALCEKSTPSNAMIEFRNTFVRRYENRFVKLVEALDPELGINYGFINSEILDQNKLIDDIPHITKKSNVVLYKKTGINKYLLMNTINAIKYGHYEVNINPKELKLTFDQSDIPATFNAFCNIAIGKEKEIFINYLPWACDSASSMIGRFTLLNEQLSEIFYNICEHESNCFGDKIIAEVNHLSEYRVGNITARKGRKFEIPYISDSRNSNIRKVDINDIYIGIHESRIILFSRELRKEIIPVISTAHNYSREYLPIYRFLGDFQMDCANSSNYTSFNCDFLLDIFNFKPRIRINNYYFSLATWKIDTLDVRSIFSLNNDISITKIIDFFLHRNIPLEFNIVDGDNKLFIDFNHLPDISLIIFKDMAFHMKYLILEENFYLSKQSVIDEDIFSNEFIIPFKNDNFKKHFSPNIEINQSKCRLHFPMQNEWIYYKIYCGMETMEDIISLNIKPIVQRLYKKKFIKKWFYVRYKDEEGLHLRLRFNLTPKADLNELSCIINNELSQYLNLEVLKITIDTYSRELERYSPSDINDVENLFCLDSKMQISLHCLIKGDVSDPNKWLLSLVIINVYVTSYISDENEIYNFLNCQRKYFEKEFNAYKQQRILMNHKFESYEPKIECYLNFNFTGLENKKGIENIFINYKERLDKFKIDAFIDIKNLDSVIHMSLLRFYKTRNRLNEYMAYSLLERYYKKKIMLRKFNTNV